MSQRRIPSPNRPQDTRMQRDSAQERLQAEQQTRTGELSMITAKEVADERDGIWSGQDGSLVEPGLEPEREQYLRGRAQLGEEDAIIEPEDAQVSTPLGNVASDSPSTGPNGVPVRDEHQRIADEAVTDLTLDLKAEPEPDEDPELTAAFAVIASREGDILNRWIAKERGTPEPSISSSTPAVRTPQRVQPAKEPTAVIRLKETVEPTIGQGPNSRWNFQKGKRYRVPMHVADHLDDKGLVASWG